MSMSLTHLQGLTFQWTRWRERVLRAVRKVSDMSDLADISQYGLNRLRRHRGRTTMELSVPLCFPDTLAMGLKMEPRWTQWLHDGYHRDWKSGWTHDERISGTFHGITVMAWNLNGVDSSPNATDESSEFSCQVPLYLVSPMQAQVPA